MKNWVKSGVMGLAMAVAALCGTALNAATVANITQDYTGAPVTIANNDVYAMTFSGLNSGVVSSFVSFALQITYSNAADPPLRSNNEAESWTARIYAPTAIAQHVDINLTTSTSPVGTTIIASTVPSQLFSTLVSDLQLNVKFLRTAGLGTDRMTLSKLALTINYNPVATLPTVPLPAGGVLLLSGLAGLVTIRRRKV